MLACFIASGCGSINSIEPEGLYETNSGSSTFSFSTGRYIFSDAYDKNEPYKFTRKYGYDDIKFSKNCIGFGSTFIFSFSNAQISECWGIKFYRTNFNDVYYYEGSCNKNDPVCSMISEGSHIWISYNVDKDGRILNFKLDPKSIDSEPYVFKLGEKISRNRLR